MVHLLAPVGIDVAPTRRSLHLVALSDCHLRVHRLNNFRGTPFTLATGVSPPGTEGLGEVQTNMGETCLFRRRYAAPRGGNFWGLN